MTPSRSSASISRQHPTSPRREQWFALVESRPDIEGRFTELRRLGEGAFSLVFSAHDANTRDLVAVKVLDPDVRDPYRRACFEREEALLRPFAGQRDIISWVAPRSRFAQVLTAPNGLQVEFMFDYYALELARGDVGSATYAHSMTPERRLAAFNQVCRGVQRIHAADIAHRDLKPSNFLLKKDGTACITDLGTARCFSDGRDALLPGYSGPPGDTTYCAPEMLACLHDVDPRIAIRGDMYSLGASLFEMFSGAVLNLQIMDQAFFQGLALVAQVPRGDRIRIYGELLPGISGRELPNVRDFGWATPRSIASLIDGLYRELTDLDYRRRLLDFQSVFRRIEMCQIILRYEARERMRQHERQKRRNARETSL